MKQLALELPHRQSFDGADFFVAPSNKAAVHLIDMWPDWPSHALGVIGPAACGKTHLAAVWQKRSDAEIIRPEDVGARSRYMTRERPAVIIEDADEAMRDERLDPVDLFHLYNWMRERQGFLMLTARTAPAQWAVGLPDLRSRLLSMPLAKIDEPDDDVLAAVMVKCMSDRQLRADPRLIEFLLTRIERSFCAVERIVAALDDQSLANKRPITVPLARDVVKQIYDGA